MGFLYVLGECFTHRRVNPVWMKMEDYLTFQYKSVMLIKHNRMYSKAIRYHNIWGCKMRVWGDRIFEKCGIRRDEGGDGGKTLEIRGKRRLSARDGSANYQQS